MNFRRLSVVIQATGFQPVVVDFFGEVHAVHPNLIPNARRDYFLENETLKNLEKQLKALFVKLHKLYYFSSKVRSLEKKKQDYRSLVDEVEEKTKTGFTNEAEKQEYEEKLAEKKETATNAEIEIEKIETNISANDVENTAKKLVFDKIVKKDKPQINDVEVNADNKKTKFITDDIAPLNRKERKLVSRIFAVIDNVLPKDIAGILKDKIKEEFNKPK